MNNKRKMKKKLCMPDMWFTPVISALGRLRQEDPDFQVKLS
jgi:hypothetical protein